MGTFLSGPESTSRKSTCLKAIRGITVVAMTVAVIVLAGEWQISAFTLAFIFSTELQDCCGLGLYAYHFFCVDSPLTTHSTVVAKHFSGDRELVLALPLLGREGVLPPFYR